MLYNHSNLREKLSEFEFSSKEVQDKLLASFASRFEIRPEHIVGSLIDPVTKDLLEIDEYLAPRQQTKKQFLIDYAEQALKLKFSKVSAKSQPSSDRRVRLSRKFSSVAKPGHDSTKEPASSSPDYQPDEINQFLALDFANSVQSPSLLDYWNDKANQERFPFIHSVAKHVMIIATSQSSSETSFSKSNIIVKPNRSSLSSSNLEKTMFIYCNHEVAADQTLLKPCSNDEDQIDLTDLNELRAVNSLIYNQTLDRLVEKDFDKQCSDQKGRKRKQAESDENDGEKLSTRHLWQDAQEAAQDRSARIKEIRAELDELREQPESDFPDEEARVRSNRLFDELVRLAGGKEVSLIGPQRVAAIPNETYTSSIQLYTCLVKLLAKSNASKFLVLETNHLFTEHLLIDHLNLYYSLGTHAS